MTSGKQSVPDILKGIHYFRQLNLLPCSKVHCCVFVATAVHVHHSVCTMRVAAMPLYAIGNAYVLFDEGTVP